MNFVSQFYIKYRPNNFEELLVNPYILKILKHLFNNFNYNYIFYGNSGCGKSSISKLLIHTYYKNSEILEINSSNDRNINIYELIKHFIYTTSQKAIIYIDEADHLTTYSQNKLIQIINQNYKNITILLCCNYINKLKPKLIKRCLNFHFNINYFDYKIINNIILNEKLLISPDIVDYLLIISNKDFRLFLNYIQVLSLYDKHITYDNIKKIYYLPNNHDIDFIIENRNLNFNSYFLKIYEYINVNNFNLNDIITIMFNYLISCKNYNVKFLKSLSDIENDIYNIFNIKLKLAKLLINIKLFYK